MSSTCLPCINASLINRVRVSGIINLPELGNLIERLISHLGEEELMVPTKYVIYTEILPGE